MLEAPKEQRLHRASLISEIYTEGNTYSQILRKPRFSTVSAMAETESRKSVDVKNGEGGGGGGSDSDDEKKPGSGTDLLVTSILKILAEWRFSICLNSNFWREFVLRRGKRS